MKGVNPVLSSALLVLIVISLWAVVINIGNMTIASSKVYVNYNQAERILKYIDNIIKEVVLEGNSSVREFHPSSGEFKVIGSENSIETSIVGNVIEYFSRKIEGNLVKIAGADVNCYKGDIDNDGDLDLVMENSFLKAGFQYIEKTNPMSGINTQHNIIYLEEKSYGTIIIPTNSSIVIDDNPTTSYGVGYSEILKEGRSRPVCIVHFFVNASLSYDIYYKLYAGADFLVIDIRNVQEG